MPWQIQPAFSHGGDRLAYWCFNGTEAVLYSLPLQGGKPKIVSLFQDSPTGLTWSAGDKKLIFSFWDGFSGQFGEITLRWFTQDAYVLGNGTSARGFGPGGQACLYLLLQKLEHLAQGFVTSGISACQATRRCAARCACAHRSPP